MADHNIERRDDGLYLNGRLLEYAGRKPTTLCFELDAAIYSHWKKCGDLADGDRILLDGDLISIIEWPEPVRVGWREQYTHDPNSLPLGPPPSDDGEEDDEDGYRRSEPDERNIIEDDEDDDE